MELIAIECPKCKGTVHVDKEIDQIFCMYCRTEIQVKKPDVSDVGINHEFKSKMAIAEHFEELYFRGEKNFDQVMNAYDDARQVGAHHAEYWLARARFYARGTLNEFSKGNVRISEQSRIINQYTLLMDTAVKHDGGILAAIETEKNETIAKIRTNFEKRKAEEDERRERNEGREAEKRRMEALWRVEQEEKRRKQLPFKIAIGIGIVIVALFLFISNNQARQARYDRFLEIDYLVELLTEETTWADIENLGIRVENRGNFLSARNDRKSIAFYFNDRNQSTLLTSLLMQSVRNFDGLALYELDSYSLTNIVRIFSDKYGVDVGTIRAGTNREGVSFIYRNVEFEIYSIRSWGANISVRRTRN